MTPAFITGSTSVLFSGLSHVCQSSTSSSNVGRMLWIKQPTRRYVRGAISMSTDRKFMVGGNWKCNLDTASITSLVKSLNGGASLEEDKVEVVVAPSSPYLSLTKSLLRTDFAVGGQNCWISKGGAFTGEIDAKMLKDIGCDWVIIGHSERRHLPEIKESDETCSKKVRYALEAKLKVIFCIGELLEEREQEKTLDVCQRQLAALGLTEAEWKDIVIAYEPVWAIGTGKVATPDQADEVHRGIRSWLGQNISKKVAEETRILYGGSVSAGNCTELAKLPDIDGFLVGGASLKPDFLDIIDSHKSSSVAVV